MVNRIYLTLFDPFRLGEKFKDKKGWIDIALVVLVLTIGFSLPYSYKGYQEGMKQLEVQKPELVQKLKDSGRWDKMVNLPRQAVMIRTSVGIIIPYVFSIFFTALLLLVGIRIFTPEGDYALMLASWAHATFINYSIASLVRDIIIWAKGTTVGVTTSFLLFTGLSPFSKMGKFLGAFDLFDLWAAIACGLIISGALSIDRKKALYVSLGVWLIKALLLGGLAAVF